MALDVGLTEDDLLAAEAHATEELQRGRNFLQSGLIDDAITSLQEAASLRPHDADALRALAAALQARWGRTGRDADADEAERVLRQLILVSPAERKAYDDLAALRRQRDGDVLAPPAAVARRTRSVVVAAAAVCVLIAGGAVAFILVKAPAPQPARGQLASPSGSTSAPAPEREPSRDLPVSLEVDGDLAGLTLDIQKSRLDVYDDSTWYRLTGELFNGAASELHELQVKVEILDEEGAVIAAEHETWLSDSEPPARRGDRRAVEVLTQDVTPAARSVRLSRHLATLQPGAAQYPEAPVMPLLWAVPKPGAADLVLRERHRQESEHFDHDWAYTLTFEVENTGQVAFTHLEIEVRFYDADGDRIAVDYTHVATTSGPALRPGRTWVDSIIEITEERATRLEWAVRDAR